MENCGNSENIWLVSKNSDGARKLGRLIQTLRHSYAWSVVQLSEKTGLSQHTLQSYEAARKSPSAESGIRVMNNLLPEPGKIVANPEWIDYQFSHPVSEQKIILRFLKRRYDRRVPLTEERCEVVSVRLTAEENNILNREAERLGLSRSGFIRFSINEYR